MILLTAMIDAFVVIQGVKSAKNFVAQVADGIVERLQMLLLLVALQCQFRAEQLATDIATMARIQRQWQQQTVG